MSPSNTRKAKEPAIAVRLALLLDGRRTGLSAEEIRRSGVLTLDDQDERRETLDKRLERARDDLGRVGIVVSSYTPPGQTEERYVIDAGLSYSTEQSIHLSGEQALRLGYLLTSCQQANLPFRDDLESARKRLAGMLASENAAPVADQAAESGSRRGGSRRTPSKVPSGPKDVPVHHTDEPALGIVSDAYTQFHPLTFSYVNARGTASRRTVEIYGTFTHRTHTYFVGRDTGIDQIRVFRVERVQARPAPTIGARTTYAIPADFDVRDYRHLPFQYERPGSSSAGVGADGATDIPGSAHSVGVSGTGGTPFIATFRDTRGLSEQQRVALTQGQGTWEPAPKKNASPDAPFPHEERADPNSPCLLSPAPGDLWRVEAVDLEETACWAALALASEGLAPLDPPELVAAVRDGLERTVATHG